MRGAALRSRSPKSPKPNCPMYWTPALKVFENSCSMPKLTLRISGFLRLVEMGRTRPKGPVSCGAKGARTDALGKAGKAAFTAASCAAVIPGGGGLVKSMVTVFSVVPSKLRESSTTLLKASMVVSAKDRRNRVLSQGAKVKPRRGCQLFLSDEHAEIRPLPWKQVPFGPLIFPPLNAPASR